MLPAIPYNRYGLPPGGTLLKARSHLACASLAGFLAVVFSTTAQKRVPSPAPEPAVILGVLEDLPAETGEPDLRVVRAVFQKLGDEWVPYPAQAQSYRDLQSLPDSYPRQITWTILFNGRNLGTVTAETPSFFRSNSQVGIEEIVSEDPVPVVGEKSTAFSGFRDTAVYRPLVALSRPNLNDTETWKPAQLSLDLISTARRLFRVRFPKASNCANSSAKATAWPYRDEDINILKTYASKKQVSLIELSLTGWACETLAEYGGPFDGQWYAADATGNLSFLGTDMSLVDAGDYDNDGNSELLFSIDGYNLAGYRLFYRNFTRSAEFVFNFR
jgi:hypothetical protein